jgi:fatty-acid desaturase
MGPGLRRERIDALSDADAHGYVYADSHAHAHAYTDADADPASGERLGPAYAWSGGG